jgi:hypothetical protein
MRAVESVASLLRGEDDGVYEVARGWREFLPGK